MEETKTFKNVDDNWPKFGNLELRNVSAKYEGCEDLVLKKVSFKLNHKQKIGIVGR